MLNRICRDSTSRPAFGVKNLGTTFNVLQLKSNTNIYTHTHTPHTAGTPCVLHSQLLSEPSPVKGAFLRALSARVVDRGDRPLRHNQPYGASCAQPRAPRSLKIRRAPYHIFIGLHWGRRGRSYDNLI